MLQLLFDYIIDVDLHPKMVDNQQEECKESHLKITKKNFFSRKSFVIKTYHMPRYQLVYHKVLFSVLQD